MVIRVCVQLGQVKSIHNRCPLTADRLGVLALCPRGQALTSLQSCCANYIPVVIILFAMNRLTAHAKLRKLIEFNEAKI